MMELTEHIEQYSFSIKDTTPHTNLLRNLNKITGELSWSGIGTGDVYRYIKDLDEWHHFYPGCSGVAKIYKKLDYEIEFQKTTMREKKLRRIIDEI